MSLLCPLVACYHRYIYNHSSCGRCGSSVRTWDMAARTVYACETCQPLLLVEGAQLDQRRQKALAAAKDPKVGWSTALELWNYEAGLVAG